MYKYLCARLLLPLSLACVLLPSPVRAEAPCWLPGMVQVSMAERQLTVKGTICTDLPPHIKTYLSVQNYVVCYQGCVDVRINDRGPYIGARELDLSYGAAQAVGLIAPGVANVEVSYIIIPLTFVSASDIYLKQLGVVPTTPDLL